MLDQYRTARNEVALDVATGFAGWFHEWTGDLSREQLDDVLDRERHHNQSPTTRKDDSVR